MKNIVSTITHGAQRFLTACNNRMFALALLLAVTAGSLLGVQVLADENAEPPVTEPVCAVAACNVCKVLQNNVAAMTAATVKTTALYSGQPTALYTVTVQADGAETVLCVPAGTTVDEAVALAGVTCGAEDMLSIGGTHFVQNGTAVAVTRVAYTTYTKTFSIAYKTEVKYTASLRQGTSKVEHNGSAGVKTVTYRGRTENGKIVSSEVVSETVTKAPVSKVILKGTKTGKIISEAPFPVALDDTCQPLKYTKKLTGKATAYTSDRGDSGTHTSCGYRAQVGIVAVNPKVIPYGTKMWIVSADGKWVYGYAIAGDTGGGVRSGKTLVDLFFDTYGECTKFGRRTMNIYILP